MEPDPPHIAVFAADRQSSAKEAALVLSSVGIDNKIAPHGNGWVIIVQESDQESAHQQLEAYWQENQPNPEQPVEAEIIDSGWLGVAGYLAVIWIIPALSGFTDVDYRALGRLDAAAIADGQWYRATTALMLHLDLGHIAANSLFGCLFGLFVGRYLGSGLGWLLVLLAATCANLVNGYIQPEAFRAIGASTATFAALGLVPAFGWRRGFFRGRGFKRGFAPLFGAIAIMAYTGFGGQNVDIMGHVFGFTFGILTGLAVAHIRLDQISEADQQRAGIAGVALLLTAWIFALS